MHRQRKEYRQGIIKKSRSEPRKNLAERVEPEEIKAAVEEVRIVSVWNVIELSGEWFLGSSGSIEFNYPKTSKTRNTVYGICLLISKLNFLKNDFSRIIIIQMLEK